MWHIENHSSTSLVVECVGVHVELTGVHTLQLCSTGMHAQGWCSARCKHPLLFAFYIQCGGHVYKCLCPIFTPFLIIYLSLITLHAFLFPLFTFIALPSSLLPPPLLTQWSYGVTCWEVFSLGRSPYPGIENHEILEHISGGGRLKKPTLCPDKL